MVAGMVFRYAIATGRAERDPSQDLKGALPPHRQKHMPAITDIAEFGGLLRDMGLSGRIFNLLRTQLSALFGLRPGEIRHLEWSEVDYESKLIRIPMGKMKARRMHVVPLTDAAITILEALQKLTGRGRLCFPGIGQQRTPHV